MSSIVEFKPGDVVRVRAARRRDVHWSVTEVTPTVVVATKVRGTGECRYSPDAFEHVSEPVVAHVEPLVERVIERVAEPVIPELESAPRRGDPERRDSTVIVAYAGESIDSLWRRFKKSVDRAGIKRDLARHEHFVSQSKRRHAKSRNARRRRGDD